MKRPRGKLVERRRFIRLNAPVNVSYTIPDSGKVFTTVTKNISADGLRIEGDSSFVPKDSDIIELKLKISDAASPVHAKGKVIWKKKISLEDGAPFDVGIEFTEIEEDNKNTFLKFLCDLIYNFPEDIKHAKK